jgi:ferritin-like metal-binding protein YciE
MLRDIYYAENQIVLALPQMIEKADDVQFRRGFQAHLGRDEKSCQAARGLSHAWTGNLSIARPSMALSRKRTMAGEVEEEGALTPPLSRPASSVEQEEIATDKKLMAIAEAKMNHRAA